ncbi:glycosyltransferase family 4 protein [Hyphomonas johnsonii]|uniref:Group 1 glycosyl transferase n=1 Tax=Hyphomonas johnsonii MHS-2 TaxID=1280950 RepID=A0A059FVK5_9PROT|nr:glycosyltransferase [Hyphomonas johnsonii]KCZ94478.1 group 1 glycosyl transferase [Hyphomonas johnsonii MHS-2]
MDKPRPLRMDMIVQRQLDVMSTGNSAYLAIFLRAVKAAGVDIRIVFAPMRSFGNRPWMSVHPVFSDLATEIVVPSSLRIAGRYWSLSPQVWGRFLVRIGKAVLNRIGARPVIHSYLGDPLRAGEARQVTQIVARRGPDIALAEYSSLGPLLDALPDVPHRGILLHDLFSLRAEQFRQKGREPDFTEVTRDEEAQRCRSSTANFYASKNEMSVLAPLVPGANAIWLRPDPPPYSAGDGDPNPHAVFLGTRHAGNIDALHHLIDDIWPRVLERAPDAVLKVAGSICADLTPSQLQTAGVQPLGRVDDLGSLSGSNAVGLAPTRIGSGVSIKVAEYLMLGMPCVVYPVALEGFLDSLDDLVVRADGPDAFAKEVADLIVDAGRRMRLSEKGLAETPERLSNRELIDYFRGLHPRA